MYKYMHNCIKQGDIKNKFDERNNNKIYIYK